jgi:hypothetical protein
LFNWIKHHPLVIHTAIYLIIVGSFFLLFLNQRDINERVISIEQADACAVPDSKECRQRLSVIVNSMTPSQSIVIVCKALKYSDQACIKEPPQQLPKGAKYVPSD